jgi:hypothetical protein
MNTRLIIITACIVTILCVAWGVATRQAGVLATGTGILGALLGSIGIKYQTAVQSALCKVHLHSWKKLPDDGDIWKFSVCPCGASKKERTV